MPLEPNAVLKYFSLAVAVVFGAAALWVAASAAWAGQFDAPLFSSFLLFSLMALSFYYFERWYERWRREAGCGAIDISLAKVFGFVGALSFVVEGILLPVTPAAHVILFASYLWAMRRFCIERRRHLALWIATAIAASAATLYATGMTPVNLLFRRAPLEALALVALLWGISALPFYAVNDPLYKATGDYKFRLAWISYAAGAALFVVNVGFIALAYAFLVLALAFLNLK